MFEVLDVTGHILGTKIGGLPTKVNKAKKFTNVKNGTEPQKM